MFNYKSEKEIKEMLIQLDNILNSIEVRGDSVGNLFSGRRLLKDIFDNIKNIGEEENAI